MMVDGTRRRLVMRWLLALLLLPLPIPALATGGVLEINQTCAVQTGCFGGDSPGFPVSINVAGSYALTGYLTVSEPDANAIELLVNDITLDLNGDTVRGPASGGAGNGLRALDRYNITIRNGRIWGFGLAGISFQQSFGDPSSGRRGHRIADMHVANCGFGGGGAGVVIDGGLVVRSTFNGNRTGIAAANSTITDSTANKNEYNGFEVVQPTVSNCTANENSWGFMITDSQLSSCTANGNSTLGIGASGSTVSDCRANRNSPTGISASAGIFVHHSSASGNTTTQIECPNNGIDRLCVDNASF